MQEGSKWKKAYEFVFLFVCAYTLHAYLLFLQNWYILAQRNMTATIHEVNKSRSSQLSTITACNGFISSFWYECNTFLTRVIWLKSSLFNQSHFFKGTLLGPKHLKVVLRPATLLKRDSNTGVFLQTLRNFF